MGAYVMTSTPTNITQRILHAIARLGEPMVRACVLTGACALFGCRTFWYAMKGLVRPRVYPRFELARQLVLIGVRSLPIVVVVSALLGLTLVAQTAPTMQRFGTEAFVGGMVGLAITRTLGPVMTAIVFTGRVGAAYTAEIGTKSVSEELLALETMGINPIAYLIAPRVLAGTITLMVLTVIFDIVALTSAYMISIGQFNIDSEQYVEYLKMFVQHSDFLYGIFKAAVFSFTLTVIACFIGSRVRGGGENVGRATMDSVVICIVVVIFTDFILSQLFNVLQGLELIPRLNG